MKGTFIDLSYRKIDKIKPGSWSIKLKARLIHKSSRIHNKSGSGSFFKLLFADETGQIDCYVDGDDRNSRIAKKLQVGQSYELSEFQTNCPTTTGCFYSLSKNLACEIRNATIDLIDEKVPVSNDMKGIKFDFTSLNEIKTVKNYTIVDIIGIVSHVGLIKHEHNLKKVILKDTWEKHPDLQYIDATEIQLAIWDKEQIKKIKRKGTVVAIRNASVKFNEYLKKIEVNAGQSAQIFPILCKEDANILTESQRQKFADLFLPLPETKHTTVKRASNRDGGIASLIRDVNKGLPVSVADVQGILNSRRRRDVQVNLSKIKIYWPHPDEYVLYKGCPDCRKRSENNMCESYDCKKNNYGCPQPMDPIIMPIMPDLCIADKTDTIANVAWHVPRKQTAIILDFKLGIDIYASITLSMKRNEKTKEWKVTLEKFKRL